MPTICAKCHKPIAETGTAYHGLPVHVTCFHALAAVNDVTYPVDLLTEMFRMQRLLQERLGRQHVKLPDFGQADTTNRYICMKVVSENALAIIMEGAELNDWTTWKHWSQRTGNKQVDPQKLCSREHIKEMQLEVIDILHFWINACQDGLGMTPSDVFNIYCEKNKTNYDRKDSGTY